MPRVPSDFDDIETDASQEHVEVTQLCAMISVGGIVTTRSLPPSGELTIGRGSTCDLVIQHPSVSRHHATLHLAPLAIVDAGSRNGTRVGGAPLEPHVATSLAIGQAIQIGEAAILIHAATAADDDADPADDDLRPELLTESITRKLDIECARSARSGSPFVFVRIDSPARPASEILELVRNTLRTTDVVGTDGPTTCLALLLDTSAAQAEVALARIAAIVGDARIGTARYPREGVTPEQLLARAHEQLARPAGAPPTEMDGVRDLIAQVAGSELSVLITGETGVGKELCAEMIHRQSRRAGKPFVKLNCTAMVESLIESELFGHERGAFTGATTSRPGLLETGDGGTVFLDEIGELSLAVQAKLLRVLEERIVRRVGATTGKTLDIRFLCATNRELADEVAAGRFRGDLYYRINGVTIAVPPLRARRSEIAGLAQAFVRKARSNPPVTLSADAIAALEDHPWPGNIRELRNTVERSVLLSSGGTIRASHLGLGPHAGPRRSHTATVPIARTSSQDLDAGATVAIRASEGSLASAVADLERQRILETLEQCGGNQSRAARLLGISRNTLLARLDAYGLPRPRK